MPDSTSQTSDTTFTPTPAGPIATPGGAWNPDPDSALFDQHKQLRDQEVDQAKQAVSREKFNYWHEAALNWQQANHMASAIGNLAAAHPTLDLDPPQNAIGRSGRAHPAHAYARADFYAKYMQQDLGLAAGNYVGPIPQGPPPPAKPEETGPAGGLGGSVGDAAGAETVWWVALGGAILYAGWRIFVRRS